ncbi:SCO family protein [Permianibacter sp. IMCC34836]|uniref:SCO family protein n=1 Tax=Permianibacter fluminis TaxID=2738515 RepID=UPI001556EDDD|nr:SCO family protein [Permianibacter fluminis]NQD36920.1 SCO family protein [Permianibacter fluminis]
MSMYRSRSWLLVLVIVLAAVTGSWLLKPLFSKPEPLQLSSGQLYPEPKPLAPFALIDQNGQPFTNERLVGKWTFIFFGYTTCPDICPTTLSVFAQFLKQLPAELKADTQVIFATVDPARDTVEQLQRYLPFFHPDLIGLTGLPMATDGFARDLGVAYAVVAQDGGGYLMDHSVRVFLVNPNGERFALFAPAPTGGFVAANLSADYLSIRQH